MDEQTTASSFRQAACPQQTETLLLDTDVLDWIKGEHKNWQGHIRGPLRKRKIKHAKPSAAIVTA